MFPFLSNMSHNLHVLSHEQDAKMDESGLKTTPHTGPSWPVNNYKKTHCDIVELESWHEIKVSDW